MCVRALANGRKTTPRDPGTGVPAVDVPDRPDRRNALRLGKVLSAGENLGACSVPALLPAHAPRCRPVQNA
jgi:hypothetical protein